MTNVTKLTLAVCAISFFLGWLSFTLYNYLTSKSKKHATQKKLSQEWEAAYRKNQKKSKLFRRPWGNKALTPKQQEELFKLNKSNSEKLKKLWQDEHL